jgi:hypothetical protein
MVSHSVGQDEKILPFLLKNHLFSGFSCQILHLKVCFFTGLFLLVAPVIAARGEATSMFLAGAMSARRRLEVGR